MMEETHMPQATFHDGSTIEIEVHGAGPTLLLPVNPQPVTGPQAEQMRKYGADPALGTHHGWVSTTERAIRGDAPRHDRGLRDGERRADNGADGGIRVVWHCSVKGSDPAICHPVPGAARIRRPSRSSADHLSSSLLCGFGG